VRVVELSTALPGMRFPVDVSGGVTRFRHRRGELQVLRVEIAGGDVERWMAPRLRGLVGTRTPDVWIEVGRARSTVCVAATAEPEESVGAAGRIDPERRDPPIVTFDVHALAEGEDLMLVVANARGAGLPGPAIAMAVACLEAALGGVAERTGAIFTLRRPAEAIVRALLPDAGARAPGTAAVRWSALAADGGTWVLQASKDSDGAAPTEDALRAREIAALLVAADEALSKGDVEAARTQYLDALERAPRHGEIASRVVDIDARMPARAEAALATLVESRARAEGAGAAAVRLVAGHLLAQVGDLDAAVASFERAGETETAPALSGRAFELAARASRDVEASARWLDRSLARAPKATRPRWARVNARLALGRLEDALADVEHLEALARGTRAKYAVWLRAGRTWVAADLGAHAGAIFERALRYAPEEPSALAGLGAALVGEGRAARGVSLLDRALAGARARGQAESPILIQLARALAEHLDDLPTAIAQVSAVPAAAAEATTARGLEGRWRARLGDFAGAALAFARLRDLAASLAPSLDRSPGPAADPSSDRAAAEPIVAFLLEAATLERDTRRDVLAAQRHLAAALRLSPHHPEARRAYREAGALVLRGAEGLEARDAWAREGGPGSEGSRARREPREPRDPVLDLAPTPLELAPALASPAVSLSTGADRSPPGDAGIDVDLLGGMAIGMDLALPDEDIELAARADELTRRLRESPGNDAVADALASVLEGLGRSHELVALLTGRLEDAPAERRALLRPRAKATFERMAVRADAAGRPDDASLYRDALEAVDGML
jgi:tetratricopeptide (TPR) repeat protein